MRAICASIASSMPRCDPAPRPSTPATASSPNVPSSPVQSRMRASPSSVRRARPSRPWATSSRHVGQAATRACRSVPGTFEPAPVDRPDQVDGHVATAESIGFPLLVKASAGGGGRGMRPSSDADRAAGGARRRLTRGRRPPSATDRSTSSGRSRPRATSRCSCLRDRTVTSIALGERDCSLQRRHQKLVEEAPAPGLTETQRRECTSWRSGWRRRRVAQRGHLSSSCSTSDGEFWFLEVNTRLQVEHGVTELVAGVDIVASSSASRRGAAERRGARGRGACSRPGPATRSRYGSQRRIRHGRSRRRPGASDAWVMPAGPGVRVDTASRRATACHPSTTT